MSERKIRKIEKYQDKVHSDDIEDILTGDHDYKYRLLDGVVMPPYVTPDRYEYARTVETRKDDVCYTSYPKSGSTWLANILYLILHQGETPEDATLRSCLYWLESAWPYPCSREETSKARSPRIFKSHMPYQMALGGDPEQQPCKYIYIARNPKDVVVSYYHFESGKEWSGNYSGSWEHWLNIFLEGQVQRGSWFDHVLSWWRHRDASNILFITYEELLRNFDTTLIKLYEFLDYPYTDELIRVVREKSTFDYMKKMTFSNHQEISQLEDFFRKGRIGSWKQQFTVAQNEAFDRIYEERMSGSELDFVFEE